VVRDQVAEELSRLGVSVALPSDRIELPTGASLSADDSLAFRQEKGQRKKRKKGALERRPDRLRDETENIGGLRR
jgi:hypothetical protein